MKYILANNAVSAVGVLLAAASTILVLDDTKTSSSMTTALGSVDANNNILITLTDNAETSHEIVTVSAWDGPTNTATITRGQDGTTAAEWPVDTKVEIRTSKGILEKLLDGEATNSIAYGNSVYVDPGAISSVAFGDLAYIGNALGGIALGEGVYVDDGADNSVSIGADSSIYALGACAFGYDTYISAEKSVGIGFSTSVNGANSVSIGNNNYSSGANSITIGDEANAYGASSVSIGEDATCYDATSISIGSASVTNDVDSVAVGTGSYTSSPGTVALGHDARASYEKAVSIGDAAEATDSYSISLGHAAQASEALACAIGAGAVADVTNLSHLAMLPGHNSTYYYPATLTGAEDIPTRHRAAPMMTIGTGVLDLTDATDEQEIQIPNWTSFYPDRIDVIISSATTPTGTPEIAVGTTTGGTDILASTVITKNSATQRQAITPDSIDGVSSIFVSTSVAGAGTWTCRVFIVGYFVQDE